MTKLDLAQTTTTVGGKSGSAKELIDKFNRKIDYLRISITDRCNLRCFYCMQHEEAKFIPYKDLLNYEEIIRIVRLAVHNGVTKIRITGGEPLVRKGIVGFISSLVQISGIHDLSLTTNGILLKEFSGELYEAGLKRVNVSMDSLDPKKYTYITGGGQLRKVWEGIEEAEKAGLTPLKINVVAIRGINDNEILDFAKLTLDRPLRIRFIEFMPTGGQNFWREDRCISIPEIKERIERIGELVPLPKDGNGGPAQEFQIRGALEKIGFISPLSNHFCSSCNRLRLTSDGKLRTCLFSDQEIDLKTPLRNGYNDTAILSLLKYAVENKPEKHNLNSNFFKTCKRGMFAIGG